jgi:hypothetical protein
VSVKRLERKFVRRFGSYKIVVSIIGESTEQSENASIEKFIDQLVSQGFTEDNSQEEGYSL